ncbi:MAG: thioredoxin-dependent thiol peroxidase [Chloroflexi bacterium]|nr:thioredoxin-dependent thiol peroxidase [Chloroflexota bacterium]
MDARRRHAPTCDGRKRGTRCRHSAPRSDAVTDIPQAGAPAPGFTLTAADGSTVSLDDFRNKQAVVLYFYPKDDTPGCTKEACYFRDLSGEFAKKDAVILGVSPDSVASHVKFRDKFNLPFPLLADPGAEVAQRYGVWKEKNMYGKKYMGIERTTFVIGKDGTIARVFPKVSVEGHADEVLAAVPAAD